jgi:hypothetical protein
LQWPLPLLLLPQWLLPLLPPPLLLLLPQPLTISMRTGEVMAIFSLPCPAAVLLPKIKFAICSKHHSSSQQVKHPAKTP